RGVLFGVGAGNGAQANRVDILATHSVTRITRVLPWNNAVELGVRLVISMPVRDSDRNVRRSFPMLIGSDGALLLQRLSATCAMATLAKKRLARQEYLL